MAENTLGTETTSYGNVGSNGVNVGCEGVVPNFNNIYTILRYFYGITHLIAKTTS